MPDRSREPLILVVDDQEEWREDLIPKHLGRLGARILKASSIQEAMSIAAKHDENSEDSLDLIVLDMRLPQDASSIIAEDGGIGFLRNYRLARCPMVVFTAYPTFANCVAAVKSGAEAYIPKIGTAEGEGGMDALVAKVREILFTPKPKVAELPPRSSWLDSNYGWLSTELAGRWVAFVDESVATAAGLAGQEYLRRDGIVLISGASYEEVRSVVLGAPLLAKAEPVIVLVPPKKAKLPPEP
jgi:CheY-like chemotaxis protein